MICFYIEIFKFFCLFQKFVASPIGTLYPPPSDVVLVAAQGWQLVFNTEKCPDLEVSVSGKIHV